MWVAAKGSSGAAGVPCCTPSTQSCPKCTQQQGTAPGPAPPRGGPPACRDCHQYLWSGHGMAGLAACEGAAEGKVKCRPPARPVLASPPGDRARRHPGVTRHTHGQHTRRRRTRGQQARGPAVPRPSSCTSPRRSHTRACQRGAEPPEPPPRWLCSQEHAVTRLQSCGRPHAPALGRPTPPGSAATALQTPAGCPHSRARLRPRGRLSGPGAQRQARSLARRPGQRPRRPSRLACAPQPSAPWPASVAPRTPLRCTYRQCGQASAKEGMPRWQSCSI